MMRGAGEMRYRATLANYAAARDAYGAVIPGGATWSATVWAASEPLARAAQALADGREPLATRRIVIDRQPNVGVDTWVTLESVTYQVMEVLDDSRQQQLLVRERA